MYAFGKLIALKFPIIDCPHVTPSLRICFFKDPRGNILELMEGWKDD